MLRSIGVMHVAISMIVLMLQMQLWLLCEQQEQMLQLFINFGRMNQKDSEEHSVVVLWLRRLIFDQSVQIAFFMEIEDTAQPRLSLEMELSSQ